MRIAPYRGLVSVVVAFGVLLLLVGRGIQTRKCPQQREAYVPQSSDTAAAEVEYVAPRIQYVGTEFPDIRSVALTASESSSHLDTADIDTADIDTADIDTADLKMADLEMAIVDMTNVDTSDLEMTMIDLANQVARDQDSPGDPGQVAAEYEAAIDRLADQWFFKKEPSQATNQVQSNPFAQ